MLIVKFNSCGMAVNYYGDGRRYSKTADAIIDVLIG